jgi:hypothetical protein
MRILTLTCLAVLVGCGGGGGNDGAASGLAGIWRTQAGLASNTCGTQSTPTVDFLFQVNQAGSLISVENLTNGGIGDGSTIDGGNGFAVTQPQTIGACPAVNAIAFHNVDGDFCEDVRLVQTIQCPGFAACTIQYNGIAERQ